MTQHVFRFGGGTADGNAKLRDTLGGKGANLAEMARIGIAVPAGFTITTDVCVYYSNNANQYPDGLEAQVQEALGFIESTMEKKFGDPSNPLLLSCRSGARESMPGMMDTVLNIGLTDETVEGLARLTDNPRFAYDSYRRLLQMYGDVVMEVHAASKHDEDPFEHVLRDVKKSRGVVHDSDLTVEDLKSVVDQFKQLIKSTKGVEFPQDALQQMWGAIAAVFKSWNNDRAVVYRRTYGIPHEWGTACNVQAMVFGNLGNDCATGVALTRDGSLGHPGINGDYLVNAQGEDVVAGTRPTKRIESELQQDLPEAFRELSDICTRLEQHYRDMQDIEFTIERGKVWLLQTRNAKRTGFAAVRVAHDLVQEGLITKEEAIVAKRIPADDLNQLLQPIFDPDAKRQAQGEKRLLTKGINAGPGAATGKICFHADEAEAMFNRDPNVSLILVRAETTPEDIRGMKAAKGILTQLGGTSSHAALVSRQMGKVCVCGASEIEIDYRKAELQVNGQIFRAGDSISIDGFTGEVFAGTIQTKPSEVIQVLINKTMQPTESETYQRFHTVMSWAEEVRKLRVRTNADQPDQARNAIAFGAEGIGLCRTEHMFFDHIDPMREMILAENEREREAALAKLLPVQRGDFAGLFEAMDGLPVTIRLLDPPLHEFLPHGQSEQLDLANKLGKSAQDVARRVAELHEANPMLGHRGCRLGVVYPEITRMQARAIFEAACEVSKKGMKVIPEVMIPLVGFKKELSHQAAIVRQVADQVFAEQGVRVEYLVGTMIEIPRAALVADQIAQEAEFFSFGTNDLTQTTLGISRDDYGPFITQYREMDIVPNDPFQTIDPDGVGTLISMGVEKGRSQRHNLKIGICGEHGGDPASVKLCHKYGLDYVSCSPFRVPVARLAAAQAVLEERAAKG